MMGSIGAVGTVLTASTYAGEWQEQLLMVKSPGNPREPGGEAGGATSTTAVQHLPLVLPEKVLRLPSLPLLLSYAD